MWLGTAKAYEIASDLPNFLKKSPWPRMGKVLGWSHRHGQSAQAIHPTLQPCARPGSSHSKLKNYLQVPCTVHTGPEWFESGLPQGQPINILNLLEVRLASRMEGKFMQSKPLHLRNVSWSSTTSSHSRASSGSFPLAHLTHTCAYKCTF